jgi:hypothetical protein
VASGVTPIASTAVAGRFHPLCNKNNGGSHDEASKRVDEDVGDKCSGAREKAAKHNGACVVFIEKRSGEP